MNEEKEIFKGDQLFSQTMKPTGSGNLLIPGASRFPAFVLK